MENGMQKKRTTGKRFIQIRFCVCIFSTVYSGVSLLLREPEAQGYTQKKIDVYSDVFVCVCVLRKKATTDKISPLQMCMVSVRFAWMKAVVQQQQHSDNRQQATTNNIIILTSNLFSTVKCTKWCPHARNTQHTHSHGRRHTHKT